MFPPDLAPEQMDQMGPDPADHLDDLDGLIEELGGAIRKNAQFSRDSGNPEAAAKHAKAALDLTQALVALVPYKDPEAPNAPGDNRAKPGD